MSRAKKRGNGADTTPVETPAVAEAPPPEPAPVEPAADEPAADEAPPADDAVPEDDEGSIEDTHGFLKGLVEAILFVSDRPLTIKEIARAARTDKKRAGELVEELAGELAGRGLRIEEVAEGFVFRSNPMYATYVRNFLEQRPVRLSRAQLETLAIIAYRQPITRPEVDDIRGVDCGPVMKGLLERDLVRIIGKKDEPGRPMLYGTTPAFLELFSLSSLRELPTLKEFTELSDDSRRKFELETGEEAPEGPIVDDEPAGADGAESADPDADGAAEGGEGGRSGAAGGADDATAVAEAASSGDGDNVAADADADDADDDDDDADDDDDDDDDADDDDADDDDDDED